MDEAAAAASSLSPSRRHSDRVARSHLINALSADITTSLYTYTEIALAHIYTHIYIHSVALELHRKQARVGETSEDLCRARRQRARIICTSASVSYTSTASYEADYSIDCHGILQSARSALLLCYTGRGEWRDDESFSAVGQVFREKREGKS